MAAKINIEVIGHPQGDPGDPVIHPYTVIQSSSPTVQLSLTDTMGVTQYFWTLVSRPLGSTAVILNYASAVAEFTPDTGLYGTYIVKCLVNNDYELTNGLGFTTERLEIRIPSAQERVEFDSEVGWDAAIQDFMRKVEAHFSLGSDDHTQYILTTGSRPFSNGVQVVNSTPGDPALSLKGASGQTEDLLKFINSSDSLLASVEASGHIKARTVSFNQWPTINASGGSATVDFSSYQKATVNLNDEASITLTLGTPKGPGNYMIEFVQGSAVETTSITWVTEGVYPLDEPLGGFMFNTNLDGRTAVGVYFTGLRWAVVGTPLQELLSS